MRQTGSRALKQTGFTLIELMLVIVILGILSVSAFPRLIDLSTDANKTVTASVKNRFYTAAELIHYKWHVEAKPSSVTNRGNVIAISDEGYPEGSSADNDGCVELWDNLMESSINMISYPGAVAVSEWSALRFGPACVYINHGGTVFSSSETPFFSYFPTTGKGLGFNLD